MTWKDIKLATLQKMYAADGQTIPTDESTKDYLAGMPFVANEGLQMIVTAKKQLTESIDIDSSSGDILGNFIKVKMSDILADFLEFSGEVYYTEGDTHIRTNQFITEGADVIMFPKNMSGTWTVYYKAYPESITSKTKDEYVMQSPDDVLAILPLYMASQLYKDDDNGISTTLRNEFEVAYERLIQGGVEPVKEEFESESGWW